MHHLVHHHPVAPQHILGGVAAERNANGRTAIAPGRAAANPRAIDRHQQQPQLFDGKPAVICRDRFRRHPDPVQQLFPWQPHLAGREADMDGAAADFEIGLGQPVERVVGHPVAAHIFRLCVGAERDGACQHGGEDGGGDDPAEGPEVPHRDTLRAAPDRWFTAASSATNAATCSRRSSSMAASRISPLADVARVGSP